MNGNGWPPDAPDPHEHAYRLWTLDTGEATAAIKFKDRYGQPPEWVFEYQGRLWVGPIPEVACQTTEN